MARTVHKGLGESLVPDWLRVYDVAPDINCHPVEDAAFNRDIDPVYPPISRKARLIEAFCNAMTTFMINCHRVECARRLPFLHQQGFVNGVIGAVTMVKKCDQFARELFAVIKQLAQFRVVTVILVYFFQPLANFRVIQAR